MKKNVIVFSGLFYLFFLSTVRFDIVDASTSKLNLEVTNNLITLNANNVKLTKIFRELENETGIEVKVFKGVNDKEVTLSIKSLPVYAIGTILKKMSLHNFAVVYDRQASSKIIYVLPEGKSLSDLTKGKSLIKASEFSRKNDINLVKGKEVTSIKKGKNSKIIKFVKNELLLKFHRNVTDKKVEEVLRKHNLVKVSNEILSKIGYVKVRIPEEKNVLSLIGEIRNEHEIKILEPNFIVSIMAVYDPFFQDQWYISNTNFDLVWANLTVEDTIKVAVIDSGIDAGHEDLIGKMAAGYDFVNNDTDAFDDNGHGTFIAGIISASSNDIGIT